MPSSKIKAVTIDGVLIDITEFPHIQSRLVWTWGSDVCRSYLDRLILKKGRTPGGMRRAEGGFPAPTFEKLLKLLEQHDQKFPQYRPEFLFEDEISGNKTWPLSRNW